MSEPSFLFLLDNITPAVQRSDTFMRCALPAKLKLEIVLYILANGTSLRTLAHMFRTSKASISTMISEVCNAIYETLKDYIQVPSDKNHWKKIEKGLKIDGTFPDVVALSMGSI